MEMDGDGLWLISIHALREEGDPLIRWQTPTWAYFYPRPPRGGRLQLDEVDTLILQISIHALREEGDITGNGQDGTLKVFLSTPSARRATHFALPADRLHPDFYPRPPRGGRPLSEFGRLKELQQISIHALREEGDDDWWWLSTAFSTFLSTPSARRATDRLLRG